MAISNDRLLNMLINAFDWAFEVSEDAVHDLIRATGITSEELEDIGYERESFESMHQAVEESTVCAARGAKPKPKYWQELYDNLWGLAEYHEDLEPKRRDTIEDLLEKFFYWVDEYNDGFFGWYLRDCEDQEEIDFYNFLVREYENYTGNPYEA